jgi:ABC-type dipeptide/oligopeptide/nickel transport system ATPase subunit
MQTAMPPRDAKPSLDIAQLEVRLGSRQLCLDRPCVLRAGNLYLVVGPSGSGKSSFARALLGFGELSDPAINCRGQVEVTDAQGGAHGLWRADAIRRHAGTSPFCRRPNGWAFSMDCR